MAKITWTNKTALNPQPSISRENKCTDEDLNEIKQVVNTNDDNVGDLNDLDTTDKTSIVNAINEVLDGDVYSTNEIKTNKIWIDSKPIYRKVVQFTVASAEVAWKSAPHGIQNANASSMRIVEAYIAVNAFGIVNEFVPNQTFQLGIADTNIRYVNHKSESNFDNKTCTCIIEYTKTTD